MDTPRFAGLSFNQASRFKPAQVIIRHAGRPETTTFRDLADTRGHTVVLGFELQDVIQDRFR